MKPPTADTSPEAPSLRRAASVPLLAGATGFLLHLAGNPHYGFFRDELYFIACGRHPAFGYVDQPPLIPALTALSQVWGPSLFLLRAIPALFAGASLYVTCLLARALGAGAFGQALAALAAFLSPVLMNFGMKSSTDTPGLLLWPLAALLVLRLVRGADPRGWLAVGAVLGIAAEAKYSVVFFALALLLGLLVTPARRVLWTPWLLAGVALCVLLALPSVVWQAAHGFPMWEVLRNGQQGKNVVLSPLGFLGAQLLITNPALALVWVAGLVHLLRDATSRFLGLTSLFLLAAMLALHAKHYYPADVYPVLFAAGGVALERWTVSRRVLRVAVVGGVVALGGLLVPYAMPILPLPAFLAFQSRLARVLPLDSTKTENNRMGPLPQDWADMQGWPELADAVARVYRALPPEEQRTAAIFAGNYGEAAAIDFFGAPLGLPPALSGHNQYWLWGMHGYDGAVLVDVDSTVADDAKFCQSATWGGSHTSLLAMPYESHFDLVICRGLKLPLAEAWARQRFYR